MLNSTNIKTWISDLRAVSGAVRAADMSVAAIGAVDYAKALDGLSLKQAQLMLTTQGIVGEEQKDLLVKQGLIATSDRMSASLVSEALANNGLNKEKIEEILIDANLMSQNTKELITENAVTEAKLRAVLAEKGIKGAKADTLIASILQTGQNTKEAISWDVLRTKIKMATIEKLKWLVTTPAGWATLVIGATVATTIAIAKYNEKLEESRQEMIETGKEAAQFTKDLDNLVEEYRKLGTDGNFDTSDREKAKDIQQQINELLGDEVSNINLANADYKEQLKLLRDIQYTKAKEKDYDLETAYTSSKESLLYKADDVGSGWFTTKSEVDAVQNLKTELEGLDKYLHTYKATGNGDTNTAFFKVDKSSAEAVVESYEKMVEVKRLLEDQHRAEIQDGGALEDFYNNLKDEINDLSDAVTKYKDAMSNYNVNQAVIMFNEQTFEGLSEEFKGLTFATVKTEEQLLTLITAMMNLDGVSDDIKYNIIGLAKTNYPEMSEAIDNATAKFVRGKIATGEFKGSLSAVASQCGMATKDLATMILKMINLNETKLDLSQQISEIMKLRAAMDLPEINGEDIYAAGGKWLGKDESGNDKYLLNGKEYIYNEALYQVAYDKSMEEFKKLGGGGTNGENPPTYSGGSKDKDKTNEALNNYLKDAENRYKIHQDETKYIQELQWAHDNLTKDEKERLDVIGKINEAYRDLADNRIKDLEHQIDLTKELKGENADVTAQLTEIQRVAEEEADRLRDMGYDDNSNEIQDLQKTWLDAENQKLDFYSSRHERAIRDIEHARDLWLEENPFGDTTAYYKRMKDLYREEADRLRALDPEKYKEEIQELQQAWIDAENAIVDWKWEDSQNYIDQRNKYGDWELFGDSEVEAWERVVKWLREDYPNDLDKIQEAEENLFDARQKLIDDLLNELQTKLDDSYDIRISRLNSRSSLLSSHFGIVNAIAEEQHNLNKELLEAETIGARMNEQERESLLTRTEHNRLSGKLKDIMDGISKTQSDYERDLATATSDTIEEITNHYERQYELKMKEYEVVKAELNLIKKQQVLENTQNEKSVRTWSGSGWIYEANLQNVLDAQEEVENAKYELARSQEEEAQQNALNAIDANADALQTEKNRLTSAITNMAESLEGSGSDISTMLKTIAETDLPTFDAIIRAFGDSIKEVANITDEDINKYRSGGIFGAEIPLAGSGLLSVRNIEDFISGADTDSWLRRMAQGYSIVPSLASTPNFAAPTPIGDMINNAFSSVSNAFGDTYMIRDLRLNESEGGEIKGFINFLKKKI